MLNTIREKPEHSLQCILAKLTALVAGTGPISDKEQVNL